MYTDKCEIVNITKEGEFGTTTEGEAFTTSCRLEEEDISVRQADGNFSHYTRLYILPPSTSITNGDKLKTTKQRGATITETEYKIASSVQPIGGTRPHHIEVYVK